jgi:hypothetical protein
MVEALRGVPPGVTARRWVMTMACVPKLSGYQRYELAVQAEPDASGTVRLMAADEARALGELITRQPSDPR